MRSLYQLDGRFCGPQSHQEEVQKRNNLCCASDVNSTIVRLVRSLFLSAELPGFPANCPTLCYGQGVLDSSPHIFPHVLPFHLSVITQVLHNYINLYHPRQMILATESVVK